MVMLEEVGSSSVEFPASCLVPTDLVHHFWPRVALLLESIEHFEPKLFSRQDIYQGLVLGEFQLWLALASAEKFSLACITQIALYPQARVCNVLWMSGEWSDEFLPLFKHVEEWALEHRKAKYLTIYGRWGWQKHASKVGMSRCSISMYKELGHEDTPRNFTH